MFRKKYKTIKIHADDAIFIEELAAKRETTVADILASVTTIMREEEKQEEVAEAQRREELEEQIKLLIPYLGEPDTIINGEPGWTGIKYKRALKQYLLENDPDGYEEYREELEDV